MPATHTGHAWGNGPRHYEVYDATTHQLVGEFTRATVKNRDRRVDHHAFRRQGWEIVGDRHEDGTYDLRHATAPEPEEIES